MKSYIYGVFAYRITAGNDVDWAHWYIQKHPTIYIIYRTLLLLKDDDEEKKKRIWSVHVV